MIGGTGVDLLAIMPGVGSWTVQVKTTSGTGPKGSRKWQPGAKSRNNPAADVYVFHSLARDAFHIIRSDVLGEEMRKGHADYVGRAETEQKRQQRLNTTHAGSLTGASPSENKEFRLGIWEVHSVLAICDSFN